MKTIFETIHGSRLYNLHHENSDYDYFRVIDHGKTLQTIKGLDDSLVMSYDRFMDRLSNGSPQSLEALFSRQPTINDIEWLRQGFQIGLDTTFNTYTRTIKAFAYPEKDSLKRQRHAIRLSYNLTDIYKFGYFNPRLDNSQRLRVLSLKEAKDPEDILKQISAEGIFTIT